MRNRTELVTNQLGSDYDEEGSDFEADSGEDWKPEEKEVNCNYLRPTKSFNIDFYFLSFDIFQQPAKKGAKKSPAKRKAPTPRGSAKKGAKKPKKEESESEEEPDSEEDVDDEELIEEYIEDDGEDGAVSIPRKFEISIQNMSLSYVLCIVWLCLDLGYICSQKTSRLVPTGFQTV